MLAMMAHGQGRSIPEGALRQRSELIEEWGNGYRVDGQHEEGNNKDEEPEVDGYQWACVLEYEGDCCHYWGHQHNPKACLQGTGNTIVTMVALRLLSLPYLHEEGSICAML